MNTSIRIILSFVIIIMAILASLFVFDAIDFDTLKDNAAKILALAAIAVVASGAMTLLMHNSSK